ncbi:MAG: hypothetical protein RQ745_02950 [Longimicrobiales bacterium]|nr:hypothetical protein [Longimicrobiales bacterium]
MNPILLVLVFLLAGAPLGAQELPEDVRSRRLTVTGGVGNAMGWLGVQAERYFHRERISAFGGLGYTPSTDTNDANGATFAAGLRGYTPGRNHRGFLELSVSQVAIEDTVHFDEFRRFTFDEDRLYGPGASVGYQYAANGGFTLMVSAGVGYAIGADFDNSLQPLVNLGFGFTRRR